MVLIHKHISQNRKGLVQTNMVADTHQKQGETSGVNKYSSLYACQPEGGKCQENKTSSKSTFMLAGGHYIYCS